MRARGGGVVSVSSSETPWVGRTHNERTNAPWCMYHVEIRQARGVLTKLLSAAPPYGTSHACTRKRNPGGMHTTNILSPRVEDLAVARPQAPQHLPQGLRGGVVEALQALVERYRVVVEQGLMRWNQEGKRARAGSHVMKQGAWFSGGRTCLSSELVCRGLPSCQRRRRGMSQRQTSTPSTRCLVIVEGSLLVQTGHVQMRNVVLILVTVVHYHMEARAHHRQQQPTTLHDTSNNDSDDGVRHAASNPPSSSRRFIKRATAHRHQRALSGCLFFSLPNLHFTALL